MRLGCLVGCAAVSALATAAPLRGQDKQGQTTWELEGLRSGFCVQLLLNPTSELLQGLPEGYHPVPASAATGLHISLRSVIEGQPEFGRWSPSQVCFTTVDTVRREGVLAQGRERAASPAPGPVDGAGRGSVRGAAGCGARSLREQRSSHSLGPRGGTTDSRGESDDGQGAGGGRERRAQFGGPLSGEARRHYDDMGRTPRRGQRVCIAACGDSLGSSR